MPTNLRELLEPIIAAAVNKAVEGYRIMLLGEDAPAPVAKGKPGPKPKVVVSAAPAAAASPKPGRKKPKKFVQRDSASIAAFVETVYAFIGEHPGWGAEKITKKMGGDKIAVSDALKRLRGSQRVVTTGARSKMTYVAGGGAVPKAAKSPKNAPAAKAKPAKASKRTKGAPVDKAAIAEVAERALAYISKHPGLRGRDIKKKLGGDPEVMSLALRELRESGKVKTKGKTNQLTYSV